jgi:hypothetical protein
VSGDAGDVLHYRERVFENAFIDLLVDVPNACAALVVRGGVSFVDVTDLERFGVENFPVNLKFLRDFLKLLFLVGHSGFKVNKWCQR